MTTIKSYHEAEAFFNERIVRSRTYLGSVKAVRLPNSSTVLRKAWDHERSQYGYAVRYHDTDVVTYWEDGTLSIATGGWLTVTTLDRIKEYTNRIDLTATGKVYYKDRSRRTLTIWSDRYEIFYPGQTGARRFFPAN